MKLYFSPGACSLAPHIVLKELNLPFELVRKTKTEIPPGYEKVRPLGGVPALTTDDGRTFTEGAAILQYIADLKPEAKLAPAPNSHARYELYEVLNFLATEIQKGFTPFFAMERMSSDEGVREGLREYYRAYLGKRFDLLETQLSKSQYLVENRFGIADAYLFTLLSWCKVVKIPLEKWPALAAFSARVGERPSVREAMKAEGLA